MPHFIVLHFINYVCLRATRALSLALKSVRACVRSLALSLLSAAFGAADVGSRLWHCFIYQSIIFAARSEFQLIFRHKLLITSPSSRLLSPPRPLAVLPALLLLEMNVT